VSSRSHHQPRVPAAPADLPQKEGPRGPGCSCQARRCPGSRQEPTRGTPAPAVWVQPSAGAGQQVPAGTGDERLAEVPSSRTCPRSRSPSRAAGAAIPSRLSAMGGINGTMETARECQLHSRSEETVPLKSSLL